MRSRRPELRLDLGERPAEHAVPVSAEEFLSGERVVPEPQGVKIHPAARLFPMMAVAEFARLRQNIRAHGFDPKKPLLFADDALLDGRNRLAAALAEGLALAELPQASLSAGESPVERVLRDNLDRRHLSRAQLAAIAAAAVPLLAEEARLRQVAGGRRGGLAKGGDESTPPLPRNERGRAAVQAAAQVGAGQASTKALVSIQRRAPEVADLVRDRVLSVEDAKRLASLSPELRADKVTALRGGAAPAAVLPRDLAAARRHEDAGAARPAGAAKPPAPAGEERLDWIAEGRRWAAHVRLSPADRADLEALRRRAAGRFRVLLQAAASGAVLGGGDPRRARDQALGLLVEGASGG